MSLFDQSSQLFLTTLFVKNFRNISELSLSFGHQHNLFIGPNGHGKTNCLEAIALACSLKPMQTLQNSDLIQTHKDQAKIIGFFDGAQKLKTEVDIFPQGKKAKINEHSLKKSSVVKNSIPLVSFIPAELAMITGAQSLKRRALDQAAVSLFLEHVLALKNYEKLLLHRNRLLKNYPVDKKTLSTFTDLFIKEAASVMFFRRQTLFHLADLFLSTLKNILGAGYKGVILYKTHNHDIDNHTMADLMAVLDHEHKLVENVEQYRKISLFGPHLDDIIFSINGNNAKTFASRGQTRAVVFSFKLATMVAIHRIRGCSPIIILDDIVSELDQTTKSNVMDILNATNSQVFFSATDIATFGKNNYFENIFHIKDGMLLKN